MKSFKEIKKLKKDLDYSIIAQKTGLKPRTVRAIVDEERTDTAQVQRWFSALLESREEFNESLKLED